MQQERLWDFPAELGRIDVSGFSVEALDGRVGDVDRVNLDAGSSYLLVATGPPLVGKKLLVPAGLVDAIDRDKEIVHVGCSEDDLKSAPAYDKDREGDPVYRERVGAYYAAAGSPEDRGTD
jgi:hypothetical protein